MAKETQSEVFLSYGRDERGVNQFVTKLKSDLEEQRYIKVTA